MRADDRVHSASANSLPTTHQHDQKEPQTVLLISSLQMLIDIGEALSQQSLLKAEETLLPLVFLCNLEAPNP